MPQRVKPIAVAALAIGALLFMMGLYGRLGARSGLLSLVGLVLVLAGAGMLVAVQRPLVFKRPHGGVGAVAAVAALLHAFECFAEGLSDAAVIFFAWGMTPYCLCLLISSLGRSRAAPIVGGALALAVDTLVHVEVFIAPQGSTAGLLLIFVPFWNNLVIVPAGTVIAWLVVRRRLQP
jgi:NADH:ubiquinone oxidoreductase subunit K